MASREHRAGKIRIKVATIHTDVLGSFIEWGGEAWREKQHKIPAVWWNPLTWPKHEWRREGLPPITAVEFFRGNGDPIPEAVLNPRAVDDSGFRKLSCSYTVLSVGTGSGPTDLGNDARSVANVKATYTWDGTSRTLSHH